MNSLAKLATIGLVAFSFTACSKKPETKRTTIFVQGDPMNLVKGASMDLSAHLDYFEKSERLYIYDATTFVQKSKIKHQGHRDIEKENAATDSEEKTAMGASALEVEIKRNLIYLKDKDSALVLQVGLNENIERVYIADDRGREVSDFYKLLHISVDEDSKSMSLLFLDKSSNNDTLVALYLTNDHDVSKEPKRSKRNYRYVAGKGVKIPWNPKQPIRIDLCGLDGESRSEVNEAAAKWSRALGGLASIEVNEVANYGPFSDLNQSCVYHVDSYFTEHDKRLRNFGGVLNQISPNSKTIIDSDLFMFKSEFAKVGFEMMDPKYSLKRQYTYIHEFGHILGLDHQFDGTPSVMSYEFKSPELTSYDREAVRELYR